MPDAPTEFYRLDPLTGCYNFLSFVETLNNMSAQNEKREFSILYADLNYFHTINQIRGHSHGDSVIRWLGIVLQEEVNAVTYRVGGDEFAVVLADGVHAEHEELLNRIYERLNREGKQLELPSPPVKIALIHFDGETAFSINDVLFHLWETILDVKKNKERTVNIFLANNLIKASMEADEQNQSDPNYSRDVLRYIANNAVRGIVTMGIMLDIAQKNSYLDSISRLPNMRAALVKLEKQVLSNQPFAMLLIDGDNIRRYNSINYAAGDEMIYNMGVVLSEHLRPEDFLARWRTGDEFIVLLPNTSGEGAKVVGERFCAAIREASKQWTFPTSISVGIAIYPKHGNHTHSLIDVAEAANKQAKDDGKDTVVLWG